jgi:hypothetical protein
MRTKKSEEENSENENLEQPKKSKSAREIFEKKLKEKGGYSEPPVGEVVLSKPGKQRDNNPPPNRMKNYGLPPIEIQPTEAPAKSKQSKSRPPADSGESGIMQQARIAAIFQNESDEVSE